MRAFSAVLLVFAAVAFRAHAQEAPAQPQDGPTDVGIRETQISVELASESQRSRFRATVLAKRGDELRVLTAAHCLSEKDAGKAAWLRQGSDGLEARVAAVVANPAYRQTPHGDSPGADNAVVVFRSISKDDQDSDLFRRIKEANVADWPLSAIGGRPIAARVHDQFGKEHVVRAGNYSNPKWLEWGPSYRPLAGDSGSGVFIFPRSAEGRPKPTLIGVVVDRSDIGGGASMVSRRYRWIVQALEAPLSAAEAREARR
jgi:hypothetical protein